MVTVVEETRQKDFFCYRLLLFFGNSCVLHRWLYWFLLTKFFIFWVGCCCCCRFLFGWVGCWWNDRFPFEFKICWCVSLSVIKLVPVRPCCVEHSCASAIFQSIGWSLQVSTVELVFVKQTNCTCILCCRAVCWLHASKLSSCWDRIRN